MLELHNCLLSLFVTASLYRNCTGAEFRCDNSRCLNSRIKCDGNNDCGDGSDEKNCSE